MASELTAESQTPSIDLVHPPDQIGASMTRLTCTVALMSHVRLASIGDARSSRSRPGRSTAIGHAVAGRIQPPARSRGQRAVGCRPRRRSAASCRAPICASPSIAIPRAASSTLAGQVLHNGVDARAARARRDADRCDVRRAAGAARRRRPDAQRADRRAGPVRDRAEWGGPLVFRRDARSFVLPVPQAGAARATIDLPGEQADVRLSAGLITRRSVANGRTIVEATLDPGAATEVWWSMRDSAPVAAAKDLRALADIMTLITLDDSDVRMAALIDVTVTQGELRTMTVRLPAGYEFQSVSGSTLEGFDRWSASSS